VTVLGLREDADRNKLIAYMSPGSGKTSPQDAWCASFINASLARAGTKGSGSAAAGSFHKWGEAVTDPSKIQAGDVLVNNIRSSKTGMIGNHVVMAQGPAFQDKTGAWHVNVIEGNHTDNVSQRVLDISIGRGRGQWAARRATSDMTVAGRKIAPEATTVANANANANTNDPISRLQAAINKNEGVYPGSRAYRNNNPGNIKGGPKAIARGATGFDEEGHAIFPDMATGLAAQRALLEERYAGRSLADIQAGKGGPIYAEDKKWAAKIAKIGGFDINEPIGSKGGSTPIEIAKSQPIDLRTHKKEPSIDWTKVAENQPKGDIKTATEEGPTLKSVLNVGDTSKKVNSSLDIHNNLTQVSYKLGGIDQQQRNRTSSFGGATDKSPYQLLADLSTGTSKPTDKSVQAILDHMGLKGGADREILREFLKTGSAPVDPAKQAWCASTINAALAQAGIKGTSSALASSFHKWGQKVTDFSQIQKGDIIVTQRPLGPGGTGDHVMIATGPSFQNDRGDWMIPTAGGNQNTKKIPTGQVTQGDRPAAQMDIRRANPLNLDASLGRLNITQVAFRLKNIDQDGSAGSSADFNDQKKEGISEGSNSFIKKRAEALDKYNKERNAPGGVGPGGIGGGESYDASKDYHSMMEQLRDEPKRNDREMINPTASPEDVKLTLKNKEDLSWSKPGIEPGGIGYGVAKGKPKSTITTPAPVQVAPKLESTHINPATGNRVAGDATLVSTKLSPAAAKLLATPSPLEPSIKPMGTEKQLPSPKKPGPGPTREHPTDPYQEAFKPKASAGYQPPNNRTAADNHQSANRASTGGDRGSGSGGGGSSPDKCHFCDP